MGAARGYRWHLRRRQHARRGGMSPQARHDGAVAATPTSTDDDGPLPVPLDERTIDVVASATVAPPPAAGSWFRRLDKKLLLASAAIAIGLVMIGFAVSRAVTGGEAAHLPSAVEEISPAFDAIQVPQQTSVVADLADGYEGRLIIDDVALPTIRQDQLGNIDVEPGEQIEVPPGVIFEPGNATLSFTPGDQQDIKNFDAGRHTVVVIYWRTVDGEETARSYTWSFSTV
jgi:hypothetical protein